MSFRNTFLKAVLNAGIAVKVSWGWALLISLSDTLWDQTLSLPEEDGWGQFEFQEVFISSLQKVYTHHVVG